MQVDVIVDRGQGHIRRRSRPQVVRGADIDQESFYRRRRFGSRGKSLVDEAFPKFEFPSGIVAEVVRLERLAALRLDGRPALQNGPVSQLLDCFLNVLRPSNQGAGRPWPRNYPAWELNQLV